MSVLSVLDHRFRGFRVIEIGGVGVLLALILLVYLAKTIAGSESAEIDHVQQQIIDERARVTLLRAEVASLEQPERLETLSNRYLGLQPIDAKHDIDPQALADVAHGSTPPTAPQPQGPPALSTTPTPDAAPVAMAQPDAAKPLKVAAAAHPAAKSIKLTAALHPAEPQMAVAEPVVRRPSELKAPAADPIGSLVQSAPDAPADATR
jgi:hypothetical protein